MTYQEQIAALSALVDDWAVKKNRNVKGPFTSGEYIEHQLRRIFGPGGWSFTLLIAPEIIRLSDTDAYAQALGRLDVTFADGTQTHQDAVGVWPLKATAAQGGGTLETTATERFETVLKAACTDALKAAAERLGSCFRPLSDLELQGHIKRQILRANSTPPPDAAAAMAELYDDPDRTARLAKLTNVPTHRAINGPLDPQATDPTPAAEEPPALSEADAREEFYKLTGPGITAGQITAGEVNDLVRDANGGGWPAALEALKEELS